MPLTEAEKREMDELARSMPSWQEHLSEFRENHPELGPREAMAKAGFTFRMEKGKLVARYLRRKFKEVLEEVLGEDRLKNRR